MEQWQREVKELHETVHRLVKDACALTSRLDDAEDRSRRDNLIFYGLSDVAGETSTQSEEKLLGVLNDKLQLNISADSIARAHRIGQFKTTKTRPLIVKFERYKTKELVLSKKALLNESNISMSEDNCRATRNVRKILIEYGKMKKLPFKLKYKKLLIDGKWYEYSETEGAVREIQTSGSSLNAARSLRSGRVLSAKQ